MTREESIERLKMILEEATTDENAVCYVTFDDAGALEMAIKALEQEPCETIKEIPKDYKYDTETKDFLVYRHMYTGHEIHIEKPVPRYRLDQQPCNDAISRQAAKLKVARVTWEDGDSCYDFHDKCVDCLDDVPPVTPQPETGHWINIDATHSKCDRCGAIFEIASENGEANYCSNCGVKMEVDV